MILRVLIYALLFYGVYRIVKLLMGQGAAKTTGGYGNAPSELENVLIKDPVCGVYFPKGEGVLLRENGKEIYFCSPECRDQYTGQNKG
jgi:YHS domain-containing protein